MRKPAKNAEENLKLIFALAVEGQNLFLQKPASIVEIQFTQVPEFVIAVKKKTFLDLIRFGYPNLSGGFTEKAL